MPFYSGLQLFAEKYVSQVSCPLCDTSQFSLFGLSFCVTCLVWCTLEKIFVSRVCSGSFDIPWSGCPSLLHCCRFFSVISLKGISITLPPLFLQLACTTGPHMSHMLSSFFNPVLNILSELFERTCTQIQEFSCLVYPVVEAHNGIFYFIELFGSKISDWFSFISCIVFLILTVFLFSYISEFH